MNDLIKYPTKIRTFMGKMIDPFNPDPEMINLVDIAHSLSNLCRWNGHAIKFYSVAQHSIFVASLMESPEEKFAGLLHDASEAYISDMARPVKMRLDKYYEVEFNLMMVISRKFGFQFPLSEALSVADDYALHYEWENIVLNDRIQALTPHQVKQDFLSLADQLMKPIITEGI